MRTLLAALLTGLLAVSLLATGCSSPDQTEPPGASSANSSVAPSSSDPIGASSSSSSSAPTTSQPKDPTTAQPPSRLTPTSPPWLSGEFLTGLPTGDLPLNPAVKTGQLDNGLKYLVLENDRPGGQVELRLVVKAGSVNETDDQPGVAHFLEHMLFNGTEQYPKNELTAFLASLGVDFGPDVTAFTSYDDTTYVLSLPSNEDDLIATALDVLVEWAARATILPDDVAAERGIIEAEWHRLTTGGGALLRDGLNEVLLQGTPYHDRPPASYLAAIAATTPEILREFYETWYQPQNMAVIAVGDFNAETVTETIQTKFSALTASRALPAQPVTDDFEYRPPEPPAAAVYHTAERSNNTSHIYLPRPRIANQNTTVALLDDLLAELVLEMLTQRLASDILEERHAALRIDYDNPPLAHRLATPYLALLAQADNMAEALRQTIAEIERARRFGFSDQEFQLAKEILQAELDAYQAGLASLQHKSLANQLLDYVSAGTPAMDGAQTYQVSSDLLAQLTAEHAHDWLATQLGFAYPAVLLLGTEAEAAELPSQAAIVELLGQAAELELQPREATAAGAPTQLMAPPEPATITSERELAREVMEFTLANGVRVLFKQTGIHAGNVRVGATSPGGESLLAPEEFIGWEIPETALAFSGVGSLSASQYLRFLSDKTLEITPFIDATREGFDGAAATEDLEHAFAYMHLTMTQPRVDPVSLNIVLGSWRNLLESEDQYARTLATQALYDARYGDNLHFSYGPTLDRLDGISAAAVSQLVAARFANAADFTFIVVGDVELATVKDLAQRYLGTLPSTAETETWRNLEPPPPARVIQRNLTTGTTGEGLLFTTFTTPVEPSLALIHELAVLEEVALTRLQSHIREELSATYSPEVLLDLYTEPTEVVEALIHITGDTSRMDELALDLIDQLTNLASTMTQEEFDLAKEKLETDYGFVSNPYWLENIRFAVENPAFELVEVFNRRELLRNVSYEDVVALAARSFPDNQYIQVVTRSQ